MLKRNLKIQENIPILDGKTKINATIGGSNYGSTTSPHEQDRVHFAEPKYPIAVIFVLLSKTFESFSANGVRTVLALYLRDKLDFSEEFSTALLHVFNFFSQFCPIFGAIIADSYLGNARTIFIFCIPYAIGYYILFAATLPFAMSIQYLVYCALLLISVGNGNLRACIASLGGHQFVVPEQKSQLDRYFFVYYFMYTVGIFLSKILTPQIRVSVKCFGDQDCYALVFGTIAAMFTISWIFFLFGLFFYKKEIPNEKNVLIQVLQCVTHAICNLKSRKHEKNQHWIDTAVGKYSEDFVNDVKIFLNVIVLYIPLPIYWSLFGQQDSTWTFQATQMNTTIGGYFIQPDSVKAIGPVILLALIPLWQRLLSPLLHRCGVNLTSLECVSMGGLCAAFSYILAGYLQIYIEKYPLDPPTVLWQIPQFFFLMMGEVWISIPGLKFSYTQAPPSMKSLMTAMWFINNATGNLIVVVITALNLTNIQSIQFFIYAALMFLAVIVFTMLARNYEMNHLVASEEIEEVIETFIYADAVQSYNLEENMNDVEYEDEDYEKSFNTFP